MKAENGLFSPILQLEIAGSPAVVLVHLVVPFPPVVELAGGDVEPLNGPLGADLGLLRPAPGENPGSVPRVVRDPDPNQEFSKRFLGPPAPPSIPGTPKKAFYKEVLLELSSTDQIKAVDTRRGGRCCRSVRPPGVGPDPQPDQQP